MKTTNTICESMVSSEKKVSTLRHIQKPSLLLADDHTIVIDGLRSVLQTEFEVLCAVGDGWALLEAAERLKPDVIVAEVSLPFLNGIDAIRRLRKHRLSSKVVFLSMHADVQIASEALRAGASAYVLKHSAARTLSEAIWEVLAGRIFVSPRIAQAVMANVTATSHCGALHAAQLTQREKEVLQLVAEGRTIHGIASVLRISARTVGFHKSNIMDKLGVRTTADLTQYAIQRGLVSIRRTTDYALKTIGIADQLTRWRLCDECRKNIDEHNDAMCRVAEMGERGCL
jgi:DNA-binding NarL/FixJ family response regulator